jgi:hypothetical protein
MEGDEAGMSDSLSTPREQMIEIVAQRIETLGLATPAILMLEAHKPLSFLGSQALIVLQPILSFALDPQTSSAWSELLEDRSNIDLLIRRLERGENNHAGTTA